MKLLQVLFDNAEVVFCLALAASVWLVLGWEMMR